MMAIQLSIILYFTITLPVVVYVKLKKFVNGRNNLVSLNQPNK